jgi:NDP-sugar pyrophosphorylase family protein
VHHTQGEKLFREIAASLSRMTRISPTSASASDEPLSQRRASLQRGAARSLDFQAVILAGGLGTRMRPMTETIPKPLIPVAGKPFLQHQLELLAAQGLSRVLLLLAYLGEQIERHFGGGALLGCKLSYSHEPSPLGTGGALKNAESKLEDEFVLLNGDTYLPVDYAALFQAFRKSLSDALIVAYRKSNRTAASSPANNVANNLAVAADGRVIAYRKHDPQGLTHVDAGVIVLRKWVLRKIPPGRFCSLEEDIFPQLIADGRMSAWVTSEPFYDMGSPAGLEALASRLG